MDKRMRCFVALELGKETKDELERIQNLIKNSDLLEAKFTKRDLIHLTLKFLGEIDESTLEEVRKRLREVKFKSFGASLGELGVFSKRFLRIIWIKLAGKGVFELQKQIDKSLEGLFQPEFRFMSHVTIARIKKVADRKALIEYLKDIKLKKVMFKVDGFFLKKSELFPEGPVYGDIEKYAEAEKAAEKNKYPNNRFCLF